MKNEINALLVLTFLRKLSEVTGIPGNTLEKDGFEEYYIPDNEMWTYKDNKILFIALEYDEDDDGNQLPSTSVVFETHDDEYRFGIDTNINLDDLKRYRLQLYPLPTNEEIR